MSILSNSFYIEATVIDKVASNGYPKLQIKCVPSDLIQKVRDELYNKLNINKSEQHIHIAFKGKILRDDKLTLSACDLIPNDYRPTPKIFVTFKKVKQSQIKSKATAQRENEINAQLQQQLQNEQRQQNSQQQINNNINTVPSNYDIIDASLDNNIGSNDDDHKQCRLCFSSEENNPLLGQLFQPCRFVIYL